MSPLIRDENGERYTQIEKDEDLQPEEAIEIGFEGEEADKFNHLVAICTESDIHNPLVAKVTYPGHGKGFSLSLGTPVYEVDFSQDLQGQLLRLPTHYKCVLLAPRLAGGEIDFKDYNAKLRALTLANDGVAMTHRSFSGQFLHWVENIYRNKEAIERSLPLISYTKLTPPFWVRKRKEHFKNDKCIILGAGMSADKLYGRDLSNVDVFVSWHSALNWRLKFGEPIAPALIAHTDWSAPWEPIHPIVAGKPPLLITPTAAPVYKGYEHEFERLLIYYNHEQPLAQLVARLNGAPMHRPLHSNVSNLLVHSALYLGYKEIAFLGVDLGWSEDSKAIAKDEGAHYHRVNSHGFDVFTNDMFLGYMDGFIQFSHLPGLKLWNLSEIGLDIPGWEYKELDEYLK